MNHPAKRFAIATAVLLVSTPLISRVMASQGDVDLTLHGTYYVLPVSLVCLAMAALLALFAGAYSISRLSPRVATWHFWLTVGGIAVYWLALYLWGVRDGGRLGMLTFENPSVPTLETAIAAAFILCAVVVILSPVIFVMNLALEWARSRRLTRQS
jgi:heme/copper-type cytochrome/quinol oxidase subunit 1